MKWEMFVKRIKEEILPQLPWDVEEVMAFDVTKNNGIVYTGLSFKNAQNIAPTIYLNPYYQQYLSGRSFEAILFDIAETYKDNCRTEDFDVDQLLNWDFAKSHVIKRLVNFDMNKELLKDAPYTQIEDLAVVYQISVSDIFGSEDFATIAVHNRFLNEWNVTTEELDKAAVENTRSLLKPRLISLQEIYSTITGEELPFLREMGVYMLSNQYRINAAVHILDEKVMDEVKETFGKDVLYVIPSSVHDMLIMPYDEDFAFEDLEEMIREVNETQLLDSEILSDRAYILDAAEKRFMLASKYEERKKERELQEKMQEMSKEPLEPEQKPKL